MAKRGKPVTLTAGAMALVVFAGTAFSAKDLVFEEYCLWQLEKATADPTRELAAERLGTLKSVRAVPGLVKAIQARHVGADGKLRTAFYWVQLKRIGAPAIPGFTALISDESTNICDRWRAAWALAEFGGEPEARSALERAAGDRNPSIRKAASDALERIRRTPPGAQ